MAKSSRRRKQDRARVERRHADEDRREAKQRADELFERATDPALAPADLAALIVNELPDSTNTGLIAHTRLEQAVDPAAVAETARLLLEACPDAPGVLAFAAVAAHASDDEPAEARYTAALIDLSSEGQLTVAKDVVVWTHPDRAAAMIEPYLLDHPHDQAAYLFWIKADDMAEKLALDERFASGPPPGLVDPGDPSDPRYARRQVRNLRRLSEADPGLKTRAQHRSEFTTEINRRQMMPPWQAERLRRAERGESDR